MELLNYQYCMELLYGRHELWQTDETMMAAVSESKNQEYRASLKPKLRERL
jgi:hypothetical protein